MEIARLTGFFRDHICWLRYRVRRTLKNKYPDLFDQSLIRRFWQALNRKEQWWLILGIVVTVFFVFPQINVEWFNFIPLETKDAESLVDQRTANIASIISISLVVVGFLISNMAIKETFAYDILFEETSLYPLVYLTLSTIACFVITSTLRDWIEPEMFVRIVISGTYLVLSILILIGRLFGKIIHFTSNKNIEYLLHEKLMIEAKLCTLDALIGKYSEREYNELMSRYGVSKFDWLANIDNDNVIFGEEVIPTPEYRIIADVNIVTLNNFIQTKIQAGDPVYFKEISLGALTTEIDNYIWVQNTENSQRERKELKRALVSYRIPRKQKNSRAIRGHFAQKMEDWSNSNNYKNLDSLLRSYIELYQIEMQHQ